MRNVIIHYHLLKNAGTTFDSMLEATFRDRWCNHDKKDAASYMSPEELVAFVLANPGLQAVSSHHAVLPVPRADSVTFIPALFVRHPLDRARSVYDFERRQGLVSGPVTKGAEHAARLSFADYLRWRFESAVNGVVHNFQTVRMVFSPRFNRHPLKQSDTDLALERLLALPFFGLVEDFDSSVALFSQLLAGHGIRFGARYVARNQSERIGTVEGRIDRMRAELGDAMWEELLRRNAHDLRLYEEAQREFARRLATLRRH